MTNQTFTTPCGKTYHVGQELPTYDSAEALINALCRLYGTTNPPVDVLWFTTHKGLSCYGPCVYKRDFPITITALPAQPEPEPETVGFDELDGEIKAWFIEPLTSEINWYQGTSMQTYYLLKLHVDAGGNLYKTREDAERGKALRWK